MPDLAMVPMLLDDVLPGHADAVVGHGDRPRRRVVADPDARLGIVLEQRGVAHRLEPQLVGGIRGVRDELAQEDLLVPVQGMDHQVEELRDLGLESEGFLGRRIWHGCLPACCCDSTRRTARPAWRSGACRPR